MKNSIRLAAAAALVLGVLGVQSCGDKESLVVVALTTATPNTTLKTVAIGVGGVSRSFDIPAAGLSDSPTLFGVYVTTTGTGLFVGATAMDATGKGCYSGLTNVDITSKGQTVNAAIELKPAKSCAAPTGAAGQGGPGAGGSTGAAGNTGVAGDTGVAGATGGAGMTGVGGTTGNAGMMGAAGAGMAGATGTGGTIQIVAPPTLAKCTEYSHINALACSASSSNSDTEVWDVAFSPDGTTLATSADDDRVKIWKMNGSVPMDAGHDLPTTILGYVAFSPDGKWLAVGSEFGDFELYDAKTFALVKMLDGHSDDIEALAFTADSRSLWSIDLSGVVTRHDMAAAATDTSAAASTSTGSRGFAMALSPAMTSTTQWAALGFDDGTGLIVNVAPGMQTPTAITVSADTFGVYGMSFSPDGTSMAAGGHDGIVSFWTVPPPTNGAPSGATITLPDSTNVPEPVKSVRYSPDGKFIGVAAGDPFGEWKVGLFNAATRKLQSSKVPTYSPLSFAWSPSGGMIAVGEDTCGKILICSDN